MEKNRFGPENICISRNRDFNCTNPGNIMSYNWQQRMSFARWGTKKHLFDLCNEDCWRIHSANLYFSQKESDSNTWEGWLNRSS